MKTKKYAITFTDTPESIIIYAFTIDEAKIISQAERIKNGMNYEIYSVQEL